MYCNCYRIFWYNTKLLNLIPSNVRSVVMQKSSRSRITFSSGRQAFTNWRLYSADVRSEFSFDNILLQNYLNKIVENHESSSLGGDAGKVDIRRMVSQKPIVDCIAEIKMKMNEIEELQTMSQDSSLDDEMIKLIMQDIADSKEQVRQLEEKLRDLLMPDEPIDHSDIILEVTAGVGGLEAMLFANDLFQMYRHFAEWKGWRCEVMDCENSDLGGIRHGSLSILGENAFKYLKFEGGVHRVQRVPQTEKSGRVHTSTAAVSILPQPQEIQIDVQTKDLVIETKRASGAGGQHVNTTDSAVRITHAPTGVIIECQTERSQVQNKSRALKKLQAVLYQMQYERQLNSRQTSRKIQIGTSGRSEKIRTYNFQQDRITDHRLDTNYHHMKEFLSGKDVLNSLIEELIRESKLEILWEIITTNKPDT